MAKELHTSGRIVRHKKRGTTYVVIGEGEIQMSKGYIIFKDVTRTIQEGDKLVVYIGVDGKIWLRPVDEFNDGRFEEVIGGEDAG